MLQVSDLHKRYRQQRVSFGDRGIVYAVKGVNLEIAPGEIWGLIGESGCGKSTLARVVVGLERPDSGQVLLDGVNVHRCRGRKRKELHRQIQLVFQDPYSSMNSRMTVAEIIGEPLDNYFQLKPADKEDQIRKLLDGVGLSQGFYSAYPFELSGGQQQRVALARVLAVQPEYLILDEPLASLDVSVQAQIMNLLVELKERFNLTYLFISHDLYAVQHLCDMVAVMYQGEIVEILEKSEIMNARHPYTKELIAALP